jgi:putative sigma-54 modulation protein
MQLHVYGRSKVVQVSEETRRFLEKKLERLRKYFRQEPEAQFTQDMERGLHIVEITIAGDGVLLRSQERNGDLRTAIESVVDKLENQVKRFKSKRVDTHRQPSPIKAEAEAALSEAEADESFTPRIVRRKTFSVKPMPAEEAARQMELLGHNFFVFLNQETNRVGVLYRRQSGDYGLIEPEA